MISHQMQSETNKNRNLEFVFISMYLDTIRDDCLLGQNILDTKSSILFWGIVETSIDGIVFSV